MSAAEKIAAARALIEPLTKLHDAATPGDLSTAEVTDEDEWFGCPHCSGVGEVRADQYINYDGVAANVLFSGIGHEFGANRDWYLAVCRDWPKVRDTVAALADLADAQAQEIARLTAENEQLRKMLQPEWFYAADGYESEACRQSVWEVLDEHYFWDRPKTGQHVVEINVATSLPSVWAAVRFKCECECDDPDECECDDNMIVTEHASEAEARAALGDAQ